MVTIHQQCSILRKEIESSSNPLIFYDDDPDGLCSYLLVKKKAGGGHGIIMKTTPHVTKQHLEKIEQYSPDKVFILDLANAELDFVNNASVPVVWVDHHEPADYGNAVYINPLMSKEKVSRPTSYMCYSAVKDLLWLGMAGCTADWYIPEFTADFVNKYPDILPKVPNSPGEALFETRLGRLSLMLSFMLKGSTENVKRNISALEKINSPNEILRQESPAGKLLWRSAQAQEQEFADLLSRAEASASTGDLLYFTYEDRNSYTKDLSNHLLYKHPDKIIIVGREKGGLLKLSLRAAIPIRDAVKNAVAAVSGTGGGHPNACGAVISKSSEDRFLHELRAHLDR